jgi:hypothetical protein
METGQGGCLCCRGKKVKGLDFSGKVGENGFLEKGC